MPFLSFPCPITTWNFQYYVEWIVRVLCWIRGFPDGTGSKETACSAGDRHSKSGLGRSPGELNGNPLQYSCLKNPMGRGAWWATVHGVAKSRTRVSDFTSLHLCAIHLWASSCLGASSLTQPLPFQFLWLSSQDSTVSITTFTLSGWGTYYQMFPTYMLHQPVVVMWK